MRHSVFILAFAFLLAQLAPTYAGAETLVPFPTIPKANDKPDYHGDEKIRETHMLGLIHQRVETVHEGLRQENGRLTGCLDCHAVKDDTGRAVSYDNPEHFCRVCHDYAAVTVDCFSCHASTPDEEKLMTSAAEGTGQ